MNADSVHLTPLAISSDQGNLPPGVNNHRVLTSQLLLAVTLGSSALLSFCILRYKWPQFYAARQARKSTLNKFKGTNKTIEGLPKIKNSMFGWMKSLYNVTDEQILEHAGLDAFVFLGFFKMAIQLFSVCTLCAVTIIGPIRLHFTGNFDPDDDNDFRNRTIPHAAMGGNNNGEPDPSVPEDYDGYLWVYVMFTYVFTGLTAFMLLSQTIKVVKVRQEYLGRQNSITDRTIRLGGIPRELRTEDTLKEHVENLNIGNVRSVKLCRNWEKLDRLFDERDDVVAKLERAWCEYLGPTWIDDHPGEGLPVSQSSRVSLPTVVEDDNNLGEDEQERVSLLASPPMRRGSIQLSARQPKVFDRPTEKRGFLGLFGDEFDVIDEYSTRLENIDEQIEEIRREDRFAATGTAFVTMDSVASAQMTAQAVLDPRPHKLIAETAPAPHDVMWRNLYMTTKERFIRTYTIATGISIFSIFMVAVVTYFVWFLQYDVIEKYWPALAKLMIERRWVYDVLTGLVPTWIFSLLMSTVPLLYGWLSTKQGFVSHGEIELSTISKNFFFVFFNMFLVMTTASGAISSYWKFLKDTTQIAYELARTLTDFSSFYVNLIVLQGIGMMPFRLLQVGSLSKFPIVAHNCKSPRDYRNMYKPAIFNFGITLPQPILIFMIVVLYSVISTKILAFGTIYFISGYFTYKYQLMYSMVHPQHSTGRMWPIIFRRISMGLVMFHLAMAGILALKHAYFLATMLTPLPFITLGYWYNFEDNYRPLLQYIALRSIETTGSGSESSMNNSERSLRRSGSKTLDEQRERFQRYVNPNMARSLDGPWIGVEGNDVILANSEGTIRKRMRFEEWE